MTSAQTLSVVSGDNQVAAQNFPLPSPLVVIAKDAAGRPLPGVTVTWSLSGPGSIVAGNQTVTDANGLTSNSYVGGTIYTDTAFTQSTVTASAASSSVTMHVTTSASDIVSGQVFVQAQVISPNLGDILSGASGSVGATPVQVNVYGIHQAGVQQVPNISVRLITENPDGPTVACAQGTGVTDVNGIANCRVLFSGPAGSGTFSIEVGGGFRTFSPFQFTVTPGSGQTAPFRINITGGNNQSGAPGARLPAKLTARVEDAAGNPLPNVPVVWQPGQSVTLSGIVSTSDANGIVSATATLGSVTGPTQVVVRTSSGAAQATFSMTVGSQNQPPPTGGSGIPAVIRITGGNNQTGLPGARLAAPLTARIEDAAGNPLARVPVAWQPSSLVTLSNASALSDANGVVSAVATLGSSAGSAQVQLRTISTDPTPFGGTNNTISTLFNLTVSGNPVTTPGPGQASTLRIVSGNNQSGPPGTKLPLALTARVEDSAGTPVPNVAVIWEASQSVTLSGASYTSDASGIVSVIATLGATVGPAQVVLRTTGGFQTPFGTTQGPALSAPFTLTITQAQPTTPTAFALRILGGNNQSGLPGAMLPTQLTARIEDASGNPVPNVTVIWQPGQSVTLTGLVSTSGANGIVSATARLGPTAGPAQVVVVIANTTIQTVFSLTAAQPQPVALRILSGNNQSGPPGRQLPTPLIARVEDGSGNPVPNVPVTWQPLTPSVSLSGVSSTSDPNGIVSATAALGSSGPAQVLVSVSNAPVQAVFNLQAALTLTSINIMSGANQEANPGSSFGQPVVAQLSALEGPVSGYPVQFTSSGAPIFISNAGQVVTDFSGRATVFIQAGWTSGAVLVTATADRFSVTFSLTIRGDEPPALAALSLVNGASGQAGAISPTEVVAVYGAGLAPGLQGCVTANQVLGPLPFSLAGVRIQFSSDGYSVFAPIYSVCNLGSGQEYAVVQAPADLPLTDVTVTVQVGGSPVGQGQVAAAPAGPGIFETIMSDGSKRAVVQRLDGSYVSLESPAQRGERLRAFVTGLGRPVTASGALINTNQSGQSDDDATPPNPVTLRIGDRDVPLVSAIYATESIGVYILTFDVPDDVQSGSDIDFTVATALREQFVFGKTSKLPIE